MADIIWRLKGYWLWSEATPGVKATTFAYIPLKDWGTKQTDKYIEDDSWIWVIEEISRTERVWTWWTATLWWIFKSNTLWHMIKATLWTSTAPTLTEAWVHLHTFSVKQDNSHPTYSIVEIQPTTQAVLLNMMINGFWIDLKAQDYAIYKSDWIWKEPNTTTWETKLYDSNDISFLTKNASIVIADDLAWLDTGTPLVLMSLNFDIAKNIEEFPAIWYDWTESLNNKQFGASWSIEAKYKNDTIKDLSRNSVEKTMRIRLETENLIGATQKWFIEFDFAKVVFKEWDDPTWLNDIAKQTANFVITYNISDSKSITAKMQNTISTQF